MSTIERAPEGLARGIAEEHIARALQQAYGIGFLVERAERRMKDRDCTFFYRARVHSNDLPQLSATVELDERTLRLSRDEYPHVAASHLIEQLLKRDPLDARVQWRVDVRFLSRTSYHELLRDIKALCDHSIEISLALFIPSNPQSSEQAQRRLQHILSPLPGCARVSVDVFYLGGNTPNQMKEPVQQGFNAHRALVEGVRCLRYEGRLDALTLTEWQPSAPTSPSVAQLRDRDWCVLCQFSYLHVPQAYLQGTQQLSVQQLCVQLLQDCKSHPNPQIKPCDTLRMLAESDDPAYARVQQMRFLGGMERNDSSGFCAFALLDEGGSHICAFRGSESANVPTQVDWIDNFGAGITGVSVQYPDIAEFMAEFGSTSGSVTGHSKGGHNALYAAATQDQVVQCHAFDGQGFAQDALDDVQIARLRRPNIINHVAESDVVGALLYHYADQQFVQLNTGVPRTIVESHRLENLAFDEKGALLPGHQSLVTIAIGWLSRRLSDALVAPGIEQSAIPLWITIALRLAGISLEAVANAMRMHGEDEAVKMGQISPLPMASD
ncbi:DUF2974 domain-containing protein [Eubacteriales bacterium OttesenSCG-928-N13]|nr:DUF2974 domain-containing protein [Eubacteriales bacterium OttesenSCG-928-N13]